METVAPAAPAAEVAKPAPAATPEAAVVETQETPKVERTFSQAELDEILEKRLGKERRKREDIERRLRVTEDLALRRTELEKQQEKPAAQPKTGEPVREQFATYEEFIEARAEFRADQKVDQKFKERETKDRESQAQTEQEKAREQFKKSMKDSAKDIEDFDDVISEIKSTDPVAGIQASAIDAAEAPGKVLYHLAKNPDEAERIASLSPGKQAREIVRLEEKLAKPAVKASKAPEPINPVTASKVKSADEMPDPVKDQAGWIKWREMQVRKKRGGNRAA